MLRRGIPPGGRRSRCLKQDRTASFNIIAMSGKAVEAAGDTRTILLDNTGTITIGNQQAPDLIPDRRRDGRPVQSAYLASLFDSTPEGRAIVPNCQAFTPEQSANRSLPFDFSSQTRMSSVDLPDPISIANARLQAPHAAAARSIEQHLIRRSLGIFGEPRVNVLN